MQQITIRLLLLFLALALSSCSVDDATRNNTFVPLTAINITSEHNGIANLTDNQFTATGDFSGAFTRDITADVIWSTPPDGILTIDSTGLANAVTTGATTVTATSNDGTISGSIPFTVINASIVSLTVTPANQSAPIGVERDFDVSGTFDDATVQNLNRIASWSVNVPAVASVTSTGTTTGDSVGTTDIRAEWQGVSGNATLTVTEAVLTDLTIAPADTEYPAGLTIQYALTGTYTDGVTDDLTDQAFWESDDTTNATVDNTVGEEGKVEMLASGDTDIIASYTDIPTGDWEVSTSLHVNSSTLSEIHIYATVYETDDTITSEDEKIEAGETFDIYNDQTVHFTAKGEYSDNEEYNITELANWTSSDTDIVTVSDSEGSKGIAKLGIDTGPTTITASVDILDISFTLDVNPR